MENLKGKNVFIAGTSGDIGYRAAKLISNSGSNIYFACRNPEKLNQLALEFSLGADRIFVIDLTDEATVNTSIHQLTHNGVEMDMVINAAGIGIIKPIETFTAEDFIKTVSTNLFGAFYLVKAFCRE